MTNVQVFALGGMLVLGMAAHGALSRWPAAACAAVPAGESVPREERETRLEIERMRDQSARIVALIEQSAPRVLTLGDHHVIAEPEGRARGSTDTTFRWLFYEYRDGKIVQIPLSQNTSE
jgi:hypothetical protein